MQTGKFYGVYADNALGFSQVGKTGAFQIVMMRRCTLGTDSTRCMAWEAHCGPCLRVTTLSWIVFMILSRQEEFTWQY